jgi:hypothetical protein
MTGASGRDDGEVVREVREVWTELLSAARQAGYAVIELVRPPATAAQPPAAEGAIGRSLPPGRAPTGEPYFPVSPKKLR